MIIEITEKGRKVGTISWLAKNADHIKFDNEDEDVFRCMLCDKDGNSLAVLFEDICGSRSTYGEEGTPETEFGSSFVPTAACFEFLKKLAEDFISKMETEDRCLLESGAIQMHIKGKGE